MPKATLEGLGAWNDSMEREPFPDMGIGSRSSQIFPKRNTAQLSEKRDIKTPHPSEPEVYQGNFTGAEMRGDYKHEFGD